MPSGCEVRLGAPTCGCKAGASRMSTTTATAIEGTLLLARLQARLAAHRAAAVEPSRLKPMDANGFGATDRRILLNLASLS